MVRSLLLGVLGLGGGTLSGLLGIGGGIIMAPLLLYVAGIDMKTVAGLTIVQSLCSALSGVLIHKKLKHVHVRLAAYMGPTIVVCALGGAVASRYVSGRLLLGLFATLALVAAALMFVPKREQDAEVASEDVEFSRPLAVAVAAAVGFLGGMVGQSGAFLLIPMLLHVLRVPTRVTVGTSLAVVLCAAMAGTAGKVVTGQVAYALAAPLVAGALVGARLGAKLSHKVRTPALRAALAVVISLSAARIWCDILMSP